MMEACVINTLPTLYLYLPLYLYLYLPLYLYHGDPPTAVESATRRVR